MNITFDGGDWLTGAYPLSENKRVAIDTMMPVARPLAIVLGLNEIASAIAVHLHNTGFSVLMAHDPAYPVTRRGMAYFDALFDDKVTLGGVTAASADTTLAAEREARAHRHITVTRLDLSELLIIGNVDVLIDARMHSGAVRPQLRGLARFTIGIGSGFASGKNCDAMLAAGSADAAAPDGETTIGRGKLVLRSPAAGRWHTPLDIGVRIYKGYPLGYVGSSIIKAPVDGMLRGIARDDIDVSAGAELIEISTATGARRWWGLDARGVRFAEEVHRALLTLGAEIVAPSAARLRLVHSR